MVLSLVLTLVHDVHDFLSISMMLSLTFKVGLKDTFIYKGQSLEEVEGWVKADPYIIEGARNYEIHEWDIVLAE